ncbi:MAG: hypothetical protein IVW57_09155 [Ktedonobacterales bacterium]|nr:hypothetical protein [Ktedonobacterales bacterium]
MGWETRQHGGRYYTRSRKVNGRVVREYVGAGVVGELAAQRDELERAKRQAEAARLQRERAQLAERDALMRDYCQQVDALMRAELRAAGYHQHDRGEWRRRRAQNG